MQQDLRTHAFRKWHRSNQIRDLVRQSVYKPAYAICLLLVGLLTSFNASAQVSTYTFSQSTGTYTPITGGTVAATNAWDDTQITGVAIGFSFPFLGKNYTTLTINPNGFLSLGGTTNTAYTPLSTSGNEGSIAGFARDLQGNNTGANAGTSEIRYLSSGNVFTVQWKNARRYNASTATNELFNFQIKLYSSGNVEFVYGDFSDAVSATNAAGTPQIGLRGATTSDFINRSIIAGTHTWTTSAAGTSSTAAGYYSEVNAALKPASGLTFTYTPAPLTAGTAIATQISGTVTTNTTNNNILKVEIPVTGSGGTLTLTSLKVRSRNSDNTDADVPASGVKLWTGTATAPSTQIGTSQSFSGNIATFSGLTTLLPVGTNYLWVTYNVAANAAVGNTLDASIEAGDLTIATSGNAAATGTYPATQLNPSGNRDIYNYCVPVMSSGCSGNVLGTVKINTLDNSNSGCNGLTNGFIVYPASSFTTTLDRTATYQATVGVGTGSANQRIAVWFDWNQDGDFADTDEYIGVTASLAAGATANLNVTVPAGATLGTVTMRARAVFSSTPSASSSCTSYTSGETEDYKITVVAPACATPTFATLNASGVTSDQATLNWGAVTGAADGYIVRYKKQADATWISVAIPAGTITYTTPATLTGNTAYEFQVQSVCSGTASSSFTASATFTTACGPVTTFPYTQGFESTTGTALPSCWAALDVNGDAKTWGTSSTGPRTGSRHASISWSTSGAMNDWMFSQGITLASGQSYDLSFYYKASNANQPEKLEVKVGTSPTVAGMTSAAIFNDAAINSTTYQEGTATFVAPAAGVYYFGWHGYSATNLWSIYVDDITIDLTPACRVPNNLVANATSPIAATLGWATISNANGYFVRYKKVTDAATVVTWDTPTSVTTNSLNISGLAANTQYEFQVQADCGSASTSLFSGSKTFTTPCGITSYPHTQNFDASSSLPCGWSVLNDIAASPTWAVITTTGNSPSNSINYHMSTSYVVADDWLFTAPMYLLSTKQYVLSFNHRSIDPAFPEQVEVRWGTSATVAGQPIANRIYNNANVPGTYTLDVADGFTPPVDGYYYIGFHIYSNDRWRYNLDDVKIEEFPACNGTPTAGTLTTNAAQTVCPGNSATMTVTGANAGAGIIYQWEQSTNGGASWANAVGGTGANSLTYVSPVITGNIRYRFKVTCSFGNAFATTTETAITYTPVTISSLPHTENFESAAIPLLPCGWTKIDANNDGTTWATSAADGNLLPKVLQYTFSSVNTANDWAFTSPITLNAGVTYQVRFNYASAGSTERLEVRWGNAATVAAMTNTIFDNTSITSTTYTQGVTSSFTPSTSGTYYVGFLAKSTANQGALFIDEVTIEVAPLPLSYNVTRSTGNSFNSIRNSGSPFTWTLNTSTNGWTTDENISEPLNLSALNFNFPYQGSTVPGLRVHVNGFITFNTTNISTKSAITPNFTSATFAPYIAPFWHDIVTPGNPASTISPAAGLAELNSANAPIKYEISGSPGNQVLTIEWSEMEKFLNTSPSLTFQVKLYEATGKIEFLYGNMVGFTGAVATSYSYATGISGSVVSSTPTAGQVIAQQVENANNFGIANKTDLSWVPECNSKITFTPAANATLPTNPIAAITNQVCNTATTLTVGTGISDDFCSVYRSGLNPGETDGTIATACSPALTGDDDDVWFTFTTTQLTDNKVLVSANGGYDPVVELYSGTCGALTAVRCANATGAGLIETLTNNALPAGTYYVRVYASGTGAPTGQGTFVISTYSVVPPPANDNCNTLSSYELTAGNKITSGNTANATQSLSGCDGTADDDVWYWFTPTSPTARISVTGLSGFNPVLQVYSSANNACGGTFTSLTCQNVTSNSGTEVYVKNDYDITKTYFVRVYHAANGATPSAGFEITLTNPTPDCPALSTPANNLANVDPTATRALTWTAPTGVTATSYDVIVSVNSDLSNPLISVNQTGTTYTIAANTLSSSTVYYWTVIAKNANGSSVNCTSRTFTTSGTVPSCALSTTPANGSTDRQLTQAISWTAGGGTPTGYDVYFGTNAALVSGKDASVRVLTNTTSLTYSTTLAYGTTYHWLVIPKNSQGDAASCSVSSFTTVGAPPANDNCAAATTLALSQAINATTVNATQSSAGCVGNADDDVWFKFTTNGTNPNYTISVLGNGSFNPVIQLYGTTCASAPVACANANSTTSEVYAHTGLALNTTYYFRVYNFAAGSGTFTVEARPTINNLVVTTNQNVSGTYDNVTVQSGTATITGPLTVTTNLIVQDGAVLAAGNQALTGGLFRIEAGGTLMIGSPQGITATGNTGNIRFTTRTYSDDANYVYNGSSAQATGTGLPATVRNLTVNNTSGVSLTNNVSVRRVVTLQNGNLNLGARNLTLLSNAQGTAMVVNTNGIVNGTAIVQRYVNASVNTNGSRKTGYRHYASPVVSAPISQLAVPGIYTPVVNPAYNTALPAVSGNITPFPNVFKFTETRLADGDTAANGSGFVYGWASPATTSEVMTPGRGYTVNLNATTVDLSGSLNNGAVNMGTLSYSGPTAGNNAGWHLLGNPYPSPIDWDNVTRPASMGAAVYAYQSTGRYSGQYRSYVPGVGGSLTNGIIPMMQGFFVKVNAPTAFSFQNAARVTTYTDPAFYRTDGRTDTDKPLIQLDLVNGQGNADALYVYVQEGATMEADLAYDAYKIQVSGESNPNLYAITPNKEYLAISGIPAIEDETVIPVGVYVAKAGTYTFRVEQFENIAASTTVMLEDKLTGTLTKLSAGLEVAVQVAAGSTADRFALRVTPADKVMANALQQGRIYPNPTTNEKGFTVELIAMKGKPVTIGMYNTVGKLVATKVVTPNKNIDSVTFETEGLAKGMYTLRLTNGTDAATKKVLVW